MIHSTPRTILSYGGCFQTLALALVVLALLTAFLNCGWTLVEDAAVATVGGEGTEYSAVEVVVVVAAAAVVACCSPSGGDRVSIPAVVLLRTTLTTVVAGWGMGAGLGVPVSLGAV